LWGGDGKKTLMKGGKGQRTYPLCATREKMEEDKMTYDKEKSRLDDESEKKMTRRLGIWTYTERE